MTEEAVPIARTVIAIVPELLVGVRIEEAAKQIGARVECVTSQREALARLAAGRVDLMVVDLGVGGLELERLVEAVRAAALPIVAFGPHVDIERRKAAQGAGIQHVFPRSRFLNDLGKILREHVRG